MTWLLGQSYRITAEDAGGGKRVVRRTWWNATDTPQRRGTARRAWTYTMKRVMDDRGSIDSSVLAEMKRVYGPSAYVNHNH